MDDSHQALKEIVEVLKAVLERDGCRCDTSVCGWCNTDGWVYVSPDNILKVRTLLKQLQDLSKSI